MAVVLELDDIQGILARGYAQHRGATYFLLRITDAAAAQKWLGSVPVTSAAGRDADPAVNVALTAAGLSALGLDRAVLAGFSAEFQAGMTDPTRSRVLGDVGANAPAGWQWGGPTTPVVHVALMVFAADDARLTAVRAEMSAAWGAAGLELVAALDTTDNGDREPFGFRDSISQPIIDGLSKATASAASNTVRAGEFVLGYPNEYALYTDRPVIPSSASGTDVLPRDPAGSGGADLGRNGSYLIFRQLRQDVFGFWRYLASVTANPDGTPNDAARTHLAARMVGRWPGGAPLVLSPDRDDPNLSTAADFAYYASDAAGLRCPIGSHVRRANPRDSLDPDPGTQKSIDINNRHRLLRRGREYGPPATHEQIAAGVDDGAERGLHFVCVSANIARQFEFIQHTWLENPKFAGLYNDGDPLVGGRQDLPGAVARAGSARTDGFSIPGRPARTRLTGLPQFVTVQGGAYFFLPGLRAIRYLAGGAGVAGIAGPAGGAGVGF
jgi:Dyp-type peroxidase family